MGLIWLFFFSFCHGSSSVFNLQPAESDIRRVLGVSVSRGIFSSGLYPIDPHIPVSANSSNLSSATPSSATFSHSYPSHDVILQSNNRSLNLKASNNSCSGSDTLVTKHIPASLEEYICNELAVYGFSRPEQAVQFRNTIYFIYNNDFDGFNQNENNFVLAFKYRPHLLKRNKVNFIGHYIIRFGATNFMKCAFCTAKFVDIGSAFEHLVQTKDFATVIQMLSADKNYYFRDLERLSAAVETMYPDVYYFNYIFFEFQKRSGTMFTLSQELFTTSDPIVVSSKLLKILKSERNITLLHDEELVCKRLSQIPVRLPRLFLNLELPAKQFLAKNAIITDSLEIFEAIIENDPKLLLHFDEKYLINQSLLQTAIFHSNPRFVSFILELVPELGHCHLAAAVQHFSLAIIKEFEKIGLTHDLPVIKTDNGKMLNALQYSFKIKSTKSFAYFVDITSKEVALKYLLDMFGSYSEISKHFLSFGLFLPLDFVAILGRKLGFSFKSKDNPSITDPNVPTILLSQEHLDRVHKIRDEEVYSEN